MPRGAPSRLAGPRSRPAAICFDLDQTLIQHTVAISEVLNASLVKLMPGAAPSVNTFNAAFAASGARHWEKVATCAGRGRELLLTMMIDALNASDLDAGLAAPLLDDVLSGITSSTRVTSNAVLTIDTLTRRGIAVGVITNGLTLLQMAKVRAHGLDERIHVIVTSEDAGAHKPNPAIFEMALTKLGIAAADAWHVGDSYDKDILGATAAGMTGILFAPAGETAGRGEQALQTSSPPMPQHRVISDLLELTLLAD